MILALLVPSSITNSSISHPTDTDTLDYIFLAFYVYSIMTSYFWIFVQSLFLYLTFCHYDGLYNKMMNLKHKKVTTVLMCWLIYAMQVIVWVLIHIADEIDNLDRTFKNVPGWTCIIGPIYLLLGINFIMVILVVYNYSWARCTKLKMKRQKKLACKVCQRLNCSGTRQEIENTTSYVNKIDGTMATCKTNENTLNPHVPVNPKVSPNETLTKEELNDCICNFFVQLLCLELVWITTGLIILSAIFGLTTVISIVIALIKKDDQHLQNTVGIVNGAFSFS